MEKVLVLVWVLSFLWGWAVGWLQGSEPLKKKVKELRSVLELDSAQKMERILALESRLRLQSQKVEELESELKWKMAKTLALESDLSRVQAKLTE